MPNTTVPFTWKIIWRSNVPPRVAFFSWTSTVEKVLTIGNLWKICIVVIDCCYMCKNSGDCGPSTPELWSMKFGCLEFNGLCLGFFFFLAKSVLWSMIFGLFGVQWDMLQRVLDLF